MRACERVGINTIQMGFRPTETFIEQMLRQHKARGGRFHWIATFYSLPQEFFDSLPEITAQAIAEASVQAANREPGVGLGKRIRDEYLGQEQKERG